MNLREVTELMDWKRQVFESYSQVRSTYDPETAWLVWREERDRLFRSHPQSPLPANVRASFNSLELFDYDPAFRALGRASPMEERSYEIATSDGGAYRFTRFAEARFELLGSRHSLELYWLEGYGGGIFLPFRDETSGASTYGAGRYLLDTVKGADLGEIDGRLVLDFNFAYNPSCSYDPRWVCPLAPAPNHLEIEITAGERHGSGEPSSGSPDVR